MIRQIREQVAAVMHSCTRALRSAETKAIGNACKTWKEIWAGAVSDLTLRPFNHIFYIIQAFCLYQLCFPGKFVATTVQDMGLGRFGPISENFLFNTVQGLVGKERAFMMVEQAATFGFLPTAEGLVKLRAALFFTVAELCIWCFKKETQLVIVEKTLGLMKIGGASVGF